MTKPEEVVKPTEDTFGDEDEQSDDAGDSKSGGGGKDKKKPLDDVRTIVTNALRANKLQHAMEFIQRSPDGTRFLCQMYNQNRSRSDFFLVCTRSGVSANATVVPIEWPEGRSPSSPFALEDGSCWYVQGSINAARARARRQQKQADAGSASSFVSAPTSSASSSAAASDALSLSLI